jgi:hypothetical protein
MHTSILTGSPPLRFLLEENHPKAGLSIHSRNTFAPQSAKLLAMERICRQCHAVLDPRTIAEVCPACGGELAQRSILPIDPSSPGQTAEIDRRGILLPRRHALGGIITPQ